MMVPDYENNSGFRHRVHGLDRGARGRDHRDLRGRPRDDRSQAAIADDAKPNDLVRPGHVFPLRAREGGVLRRAGQTEGSVDLARLAGMKPAGVICEIMNDDGTMARMPDLEWSSRTRARPQDRDHRRPDPVPLPQGEARAPRGAIATMPTRVGDFRAIVYENDIDHVDHMALVKGEIDPDDRFWCGSTASASPATRSAPGAAIAASSSSALKMIEDEGSGVLLYMRQEGRGIGLKNKIRAYALQDEEGLDTVEANERLGFPAGPARLRRRRPDPLDLGVRKMRMITNNPGKRAGIEGYGLKIVERVPLEIKPNEKNLEYLRTKKEKLGHVLHLMS